MKKIFFQKKYQFILGGIFILFLAVPMIILAEAYQFEQYKTIAVPKTATSAPLIKSIRTEGITVTGHPFVITSFSNKQFLIPNKTAAEWNAFAQNSPNYMSVSVCGDSSCTTGEDFATCPGDCPKITYEYCGNGICEISDNGCLECPDDCGTCAVSQYCGVCGSNPSTGELCVNRCWGNTLSMTNCIYNHIEIKQMYNGCLHVDDDCLFYAYDSNYYNVRNINRYSCGDLDPTILCPAGQYCRVSGGIKVSSAVDCPAGKYCPEGSIVPQTCPPGTWSAPRSSECTSCRTPNEEEIGMSPPGSDSPNDCIPIQACGDNYCRTDKGENPKNCPNDCQTANDGRCTGSENYINTPNDCHCGDDICNYDENLFSCKDDCPYCGNNVCDSGENATNCLKDCHCNNGVCEALYKETSQTCLADCKCGNGSCDTGETYSNCSADCKCGDNICSPAIGETSSSCAADCKCGNDVCNSNESAGTCMGDCHCGNGTCQSAYFETMLNCPHDCANSTCGNGSCSLDEKNSGSCVKDCGSSGIKEPLLR